MTMDSGSCLTHRARIGEVAHAAQRGRARSIRTNETR